MAPATIGASAKRRSMVPNRNSWPERSEGHERSLAGVYVYVFDHPEGKATVKYVCVYV